MSDNNQQHAAYATELSSALKELHRALIRAEVGDDPELANPYTMLFALIGDPRFAWMGVLSELIARIDQLIVDAEIGDPGVLIALRAEAAGLIGEGGGEAVAPFRLRHLAAIQTEHEVGFATGRLRKLLTQQAKAPR